MLTGLLTWGGEKKKVHVERCGFFSRKLDCWPHWTAVFFCYYLPTLLRKLKKNAKTCHLEVCLLNLFVRLGGLLKNGVLYHFRKKKRIRTQWYKESLEKLSFSMFFCQIKISLSLFSHFFDSPFFKKLSPEREWFVWQSWKSLKIRFRPWAFQSCINERKVGLGWWLLLCQR